MENKKISIQELTDAIAAQSGETKRFTESFLRELVLVIQEYLEKDGVVKVKGLGTFKLMWNEPRKSVDVSTGDTIVLSGHYKVTFTPEAAVKERINGPYAHLDTVMGGAEVLSEVAEPEQELVSVCEESVSSRSSIQDSVVEAAKLQPESINEANNVASSMASEPAEGPNKVKVTKSSKKKMGGVVWGVLLLLCLLGAAGFYWRNVWIPQQNTMSPSQIKAPVVITRVDTIDEVIADTVTSLVDVVEDTASVAEKLPLTLENYTYHDALNAPVRETVTVIDGSRLTMVAYRAFGHKAFWVYVYDANRNVLNSPNAVEKGMQLVIPDLPLSIVNPKSQLCIEKALELAKEY